MRTLLVVGWIWTTLCLALPAGAAFEFKDKSWEGASELYAIAKEELGPERVRLVATLDFSELTPSDGILILHPQAGMNDQELTAFLRVGGRAAIIDDYGEAPSVLSRFQIHRIAAPKRPRSALRENPSLAVAVPAVEQAAGIEQGRHPIVANVAQVMTNHPTALRHPELTPVLKIEALDEPDATIAVTGIIKKGRLFAMSDPSCVMNLMLRYPGNRAFAQGLVHYLVEDDTWGEREGKLYLLSNRFRQTGHVGGKPSLGQEAAAALRGAADRLGEVHDDGLPRSALILLTAVFAVSSAGWVLWVTSRTYQRSGPQFARATPLVAQGGAAGRAAVLAAPTTSPALVVVELKAALEEGLAHALRLSPGTHSQRLLEEIERLELLSAHELDDLRQLMARLSRAEASMAAAQPTKLKPAHVQDLNRKVKEILQIIGERLGNPS